jgi:hypothetical protein
LQQQQQQQRAALYIRTLARKDGRKIENTLQSNQIAEQCDSGNGGSAQVTFCDCVIGHETRHR